MSNDRAAELIASRLFDADWYSEEYRDVGISVAIRQSIT